MALVTYVQHDGARQDVDVPVGDTIMQGAINNMVDGIVAECGGGLACATCHCYVADEWSAKTGEASLVETEMLEAVSAERKTTSRLSCQITVTEELDGIVIYLPATQF
jgi:2Fe-2S ferredoxin